MFKNDLIRCLKHFELMSAKTHKNFHFCSASKTYLKISCICEISPFDPKVLVSFIWLDLCFSLEMAQRLAWRWLLGALCSDETGCHARNELFYKTFSFEPPTFFILSVFFFLFTHLPSGRFIFIVHLESGGICSKTCPSLS